MFEMFTDEQIIRYVYRIKKAFFGVESDRPQSLNTPSNTLTLPTFSDVQRRPRRRWTVKIPDTIKIEIVQNEAIRNDTA